MASGKDQLAATLAQTVAHVDQAKVQEMMETVADLRGQGQKTTLLDVMLEQSVIDEGQAKEISKQVKKKFRSELGDFKILKKLGEGGMGAVYHARQISMDREVALKVLSKELSKNKDFVGRFIREARSSAKLDHPNVVRGYAVGEADGLHYFAMEFVDGESVQDILDRQGKLDVAEAVRIARDVTLALEQAQQINMVHRDIKPDNIMITRERVVKLADLGLAKQLDEDSQLTQTGTGFGTPFYMPPEQAKNAKYVDGRCDIYALGATLYHMVAGVVPFTGDTPMEVLTKKELGEFRRARLCNENVPERLDLIIDKMMAKEPKYRYQQCDELIKDLEATGLITPSGGYSTPPPPSAAPKLSGSATPSALGTKAAAKKAPGDPNVWFVRFKDVTGKRLKMKTDAETIRKLIREEKIVLGATASHDANEGFQPLQSYDEFRDLMSARLVAAKADLRAGGKGSMAEQYAQFERERAHKKRMEALKRWAIRLVILAVVLIGAYIGLKKAGVLDDIMPPQEQSKPAPPALAPPDPPDEGGGNGGTAGGGNDEDDEDWD